MRSSSFHVIFFAFFVSDFALFGRSLGLSVFSVLSSIVLLGLSMLALAGLFFFIIIA